MTYAEDFSHRDLAKIERTTQEIGRYVFDRLGRGAVSIFDRRWWDDRIMAWAMQDESVKVQMFRFIDVLPMLRSSDDVTRHLHEYFDDVKDHLPSAVRLGMAVAAPRTLAGRALALTARRNALSHARRFIAGVNTAEVLAVALRERKLKRAITLDILGEAVTSEVEAERYFQAYLDLIRGIAPAANAWPEVAQIDRGLLSALPRVNVSVKLSALDSQFDAIDPEGTAERVKSRLRQLLRVAREHRAFVHVDMESYRTKDMTLAIFRQVLSEDEFRQTGDVGIVIQCYLKDAAHDLVVLRDWAQERGTPVWVRLVKGAYWDYETIHASAAGWPIPVLQQKWESDANFERQSRFVLRNSAYLRPALASHNIRSLAHGLAVARHIGLPQTGLELQMLYGMADAEKQVFVDLGYRLRIYMPYGDLIPGMAYLVRRLLENTSNDSFLRASFSRKHRGGEINDESQRTCPGARRPPDRFAVARAASARQPLSQSAGDRFHPGGQPRGNAPGDRQRTRPPRSVLPAWSSTVNRSAPADIWSRSILRIAARWSAALPRPGSPKPTVPSQAARRAWPAWAATRRRAAGRVFAPRRRRPAPPAVRAGCLGNRRMWQGMARGRCRRLRGDRLRRVLRRRCRANGRRTRGRRAG